MAANGGGREHVVGAVAFAHCLLFAKRRFENRAAVNATKKQKFTVHYACQGLCVRSHLDSLR